MNATGTVILCTTSEVLEQRAFERGERQLVDAQRAHQRMRRSRRTSVARARR